MTWSGKLLLELSITVRQIFPLLTLHRLTFCSIVGQTPRKLFNTPHPERYHHGLHSLPLGTLHGIEEDPHLLTQNSRCFKGEIRSLCSPCS